MGGKTKQPFTLEQFKKEFESDATRRCAAQEATIKELHEKLRESQTRCNQLEKQLKAFKAELSDG